jgi:hypothetical protein
MEGIPIFITRSLLLSFRILSFTSSPDSILTVLVITRLTTSQTGPLYPATVGFRPTDLSAGRPITADPLKGSQTRAPHAGGEPSGPQGRARLRREARAPPRHHSRTGPLYPATVTVGFRPTDLSAAGKAAKAHKGASESDSGGVQVRVPHFADALPVAVTVRVWGVFKSVSESPTSLRSPGLARGKRSSAAAYQIPSHQT